MSTVSAEIVFRLRKPMTPIQMAHAIYRAIGVIPLVVQGTKITVVCQMPAGSRIEEDTLEVVSIEAEPLGGPRH